MAYAWIMKQADEAKIKEALEWMAAASDLLDQAHANLKDVGWDDFTSSSRTMLTALSLRFEVDGLIGNVEAEMKEDVSDAVR